MTASDDDKTSNLLANKSLQGEDGELTQNLIINNRNTEAIDGKLELSQYIVDVQSERDKRTTGY